MSDPGDLTAFLDLAWQHLRRGAADSRSPARYPTLATVSPEGLPEARTVALRAASQESACLEIHTDSATPKIRALRADPRAALHVWLPRADLQIRLTSTVTILTGDEADAAWARVPAAARVSYGTDPAPGTPIETVHAYDKPARRARFALLRCRVDHIDLVELKQPHRRAEFARATDWEGSWLAP